MKQIVMLGLMVALFPILCHAVDKQIFFNYGHEFYDQDDFSVDRINYGKSMIVYKSLLAEQTTLNLTRINKDPWNDMKDNYSIASLASGLIGSFVNTSFMDSTSEAMKIMILSIPILANSTVYLPLMKSSSAIKTLNVAPFIKNDTDVFMFRSATWGQLTPGAGLRVYFGNKASEMGVAIGAERSLQSDFTAKTRSKNIYFIKAGMNFMTH